MIILYVILITIILMGMFVTRKKIKQQSSGKRLSIDIFLPLAHRLLDKTGLSNNWNQVKYQNMSFRLAVVICMTFITSLLLLLMSLLNNGAGNLSDNKIRRPDYQEEARQYSVEIYKDNDSNPQEVELEVEPREYTLEEAKKHFTKAYEYLLEAVRNQNKSLDKVTGDLFFPTEIPQYSINIDWNISNYDLINGEGKVNNEDFAKKGIEKQEVVITPVLKYGEYESDFPIDVIIYPPEAESQKKIEQILEEAVKGNKEQEYVELPGEVEGSRYTYRIKEDDGKIAILFLGVSSAVLWIVFEENKKKKKNLERERQLILDYSEVVSKLTLLSGAGMTIYKAWERIVLDYREKMKSQNNKKHYVYEEMLTTYHQMKSGIPETEAYVQFGRRCNLKEYVKLGILLQQNLKKGTKGLAVILENECIQAFEQRKNQARKLGEEAGTKLLIPMILMLIVTMVIVIFPAFLSMNL